MVAEMRLNAHKAAPLTELAFSTIPSIHLVYPQLLHTRPIHGPYDTFAEGLQIQRLHHLRGTSSMLQYHATCPPPMKLLPCGRKPDKARACSCEN